MARRRRAPTDGASPAPRERRVLDARAAKLAAADLLSRRAWTEAELTRRLTRRGAPPEVAAAVVTEMVRRGHVDDASFARHFVETRGTRGYGAARLAADLRARGVGPGLISAALAGLEPGRELERARAIAERRLPTLARVAPERAAGRLRDHLLRRGFAAGVVMRVVREALRVDD